MLLKCEDRIMITAHPFSYHQRDDKKQKQGVRKSKEKTKFFSLTETEHRGEEKEGKSRRMR